MQSTRARDKSVLPFPSPSLEEILMSRFGFRIDMKRHVFEGALPSLFS